MNSLQGEGRTFGDTVPGILHPFLWLAAKILKLHQKPVFRRKERQP